MRHICLSLLCPPPPPTGTTSCMHSRLEPHTLSTTVLSQTSMCRGITQRACWNAGKVGGGSLKFCFSNKFPRIPCCWSRILCWVAQGWMTSQCPQAPWCCHTLSLSKNRARLLLPIPTGQPSSCKAWIKHQLLCEASVRCASLGTSAPSFLWVYCGFLRNTPKRIKDLLHLFVFAIDMLLEGEDGTTASSFPRHSTQCLMQGRG